MQVDAVAIDLRRQAVEPLRERGSRLLWRDDGLRGRTARATRRRLTLSNSKAEIERTDTWTVMSGESFLASLQLLVAQREIYFLHAGRYIHHVCRTRLSDQGARTLAISGSKRRRQHPDGVHRGHPGKLHAGHVQHRQPCRPECRRDQRRRRSRSECVSTPLREAAPEDVDGREHDRGQRRSSASPARIASSTNRRSRSRFRSASASRASARPESSSSDAAMFSATGIAGPKRSKHGERRDPDDDTDGRHDHQCELLVPGQRCDGAFDCTQPTAQRHVPHLDEDRVAQQWQRCPYAHADRDERGQHADRLHEYFEGGQLRGAVRLGRLERADVRASLSPANTEGISPEDQYDEQ